MGGRINLTLQLCNYPTLEYLTFLDKLCIENVDYQRNENTMHMVMEMQCITILPNSTFYLQISTLNNVTPSGLFKSRKSEYFEERM